MTNVEAQRAGLSGFSLWVGYAAMCIGMFMAILDIQIVITSLPVIQEALGIGPERMSWVQTSYLIAEVIAIPLTGLLTRIFSLRWLFAAGVILFTLSSIGCAMSTGFIDLIAFRIVQGVAGGILIPLVFSAVFLLFQPGFQQTLAVTMAGVLAVLAPALGPITGGLLTESFSWHWLFLINVGPGIVCLLAGVLCLPRIAPQFSLLRHLDWMSLAAIALALAALEIALKEAPDRGWFSPEVLGLTIVVVVALWFAVKRPAPVIDFPLLGDRNLAYGCALSFILGVGLFGSVYLMPVHLAFVRSHGPIDIGVIILVTGIAQLITAPIAVALDRRYSARLLSAIGFTMFAIGMLMSAFESRLSDYDEMFWPQVVRGAFVALCILPPTRFALGLMPLDRVSDASGLFNLSRNLGGAIGIALLDTILFGRTEDHGEAIMAQITAEPEAAAALMGIPVTDLPDPEDPMGLLAIADIVQEQAFAMSINEGWMLLSGITVIALLLLRVMGPIRAAGEAPRVQS
jgi:DHA2 family multidrug resistance protein